jgi:hypothetical protein
VTAIRGGLGIVTGVLLAPAIFLWSLIKGARAVHADGVLCRAELIADDAVVGPRLAGPALARFSGAMQRDGASSPDILGLALRLRATAEADAGPEVGDQDLVVGTFESFATAMKDKARTRVDDYLANEYDTVTPWRVEGVGVVRLRAVPGAARDPARGANRQARLAADIAAGVAELALGTHPDDGGTGPVTRVATIRITGISELDASGLREQLSRRGRGVTAVGYRNGIRRVVYPVSQAARRIRGG